ncbi:transmembrane amino acid transporter [Exophiala viscosa]|uniref:Transmembrane amino acid transporter n=1 Tax=Exophiala viscosa TaxID=2486360 RepID=A0AAN6DU88_9EURO|nr:transmembrane amino acid transporter [Exophiala viscosa]KAI1623397.1 transmembrane amino acid transporter [Exophiala viscosa]
MSTDYEKYRYRGPGEADGAGPDGLSSTRVGDDSPTDGAGYQDHDVFGDEANAAIRYKTLSWPMVALLMIAEIVSNGMLSLPAATAVVGIVPGVILIAFLGVFALYTSLILIDFKMNHGEVHNMGDAGLIMGGPILREILAGGTVIFAVFATGSQLLAGQITLNVLSDGKLCLMWYTGIFAIPTLLLSFPRTLDQLSWLCIPSCLCILVAGIVGMAAAGAYPAPDRHIVIAQSASFYDAFVAITNPVFAYAGHFMFFILISEMHSPKDAKKAAWVLQTFATSFYIVFTIVMYIYLGPSVQSPAFSSLPTKWAKATYGIALPNFLIAGSLYSHTAAKLFFIRMFRRTRHLHQHTFLGWGTWTILIILANGAAFVLAVGVPIFAYLVSIAASLFASWYTYGIAGAFWLYDAYHGFDKGPLRGVYGFAAWKKSPIKAVANIATFFAGAFICVAGTYVSIKLIIDAYNSGSVGAPFAC